MGNRKGLRSLNVVFTKDKHGSVFLVGMYGQYWNAADEEKIQQAWGYETALLELRNNERFELPINNLKWHSNGRHE
ncbi:hypothetical protein EBB07_29330 [Paenibacillaceae bacterium]|nr:hypothetical protein EBB07_29330 [Paenibacillaceae bacterium]